MIGFFKLIFGVGVYFLVLNTAECQVTVSNLNGVGKFLCGHRTLLECAIPGYLGGMAWKLDGTIIAQCAFGTCTALGALPSGDIFTYDETAKTFNLNISITHADNGTMYQCDDSSNQDQTTVNIQVPPSESAFNMTITENATSITVEAGCFYPSNAGRMDVICDKDGKKVGEKITMTPTTTGCSGDCAGPNIYTAVGSYKGNLETGNSRYRFEVYHKDFKQNAVTYYSSAKYNCEKHSTSPPPCSSTPPPPGTTCIIIIVVCVVELLIIIIIIVCCCIRKRKQNKAAKGLNLAEKNDKNDQNNIPLGEPVPDGMNEKKQDLNNKPTGESVHNVINEKKQDLNKVEHKF